MMKPSLVITETKLPQAERHMPVDAWLWTSSTETGSNATCPGPSGVMPYFTRNVLYLGLEAKRYTYLPHLVNEQPRIVKLELSGCPLESLKALSRNVSF